MRRVVIGKVSVPAIHYWEDAKGWHGYLHHPHRHTFEIEVRVEVSHNNREVEIFALQEDILNCLKAEFPTTNGSYFDFQGNSCEDIAQMLGTKLNAVSVQVLEDGKGGAEVCFTTT